MRKLIVGTTAAALLLVAPGFAAPAQADHVQWFVGSAFSVGPLHFNIVARNPDYGPRGYYYRVARPVHYRGHQCTSRCFRSGSYYYHDPYCPAVQYHFDRYGYSPYRFHDRYAPGYQGRGGYGGYYQDRGYRHRGVRHRTRPYSRPYRHHDHDDHDDHHGHGDRDD